MVKLALGERLAGVKYQIFATVVANICCLGQGCAVGWTSPSLPLLRSAESPLASGPVDAGTAAWIGAILPVGAVCGTLSFGLLSNFVGSKRAMLLCVLPLIVHWIIVLLASEAWVLIVARYLSGLTGGGMFICISLYVAEIANERVRGVLSSMLQLSFNTGIVLGYVAGTYLDYFTVPLVLIVLPIVFFSVFVWLPNTPQYLLKCNEPTKAEQSLRWYRNVGTGSGDVQSETKLCEELDKFVLIAKQNACEPAVRVGDFLTREALRGMLIGPTLMAVAQFSGTFTLSNYASTIFRATGSDMDPNVSSMIMGSIQVVGTICASTFIDRLGRKILLLISSAGSAMALFVTGTFAYLKAEDYDVAAFNWLPVVSLSFFIFISAVGLTPVPYVLVSEVLPQKIRRIGGTICVCTVSVYAFIMLRFFPVMLATFQLHGCMWFFACVSIAGLLFTLFVVSETKGKNLDQIQDTKDSVDRS